MADSVVCASNLFSNRTICAVMKYIDIFLAKAESAYADSQTRLEDLGVLTEQIAADMAGIDYSPATGGINITYSRPDVPNFSTLGPDTPAFPDKPTVSAPTIEPAPTVPDAYVVPAADSQLISAAVFDALYDREQERISRQSAKGERDAVYRAGRLGVGGSTAALQLGLQEAEEATDEGVSSVARDKAVSEGEWLRADVKTLHGMHIEHDLERPKLALESYKAENTLEVDAYRVLTGGFRDINAAMAGVYDSQVRLMLGYLGAESDRLRALVASEAERRGWTELQSKNALADANAVVKYAIDKVDRIGELKRKTHEADSALSTGYLQALVSASNVALSGSGGQSVTENV